MPVARDVAQLVVRSFHKREVVGSRPTVTTTRLTGRDFVLIDTKALCYDHCKTQMQEFNSLPGLKFYVLK